MLACSARPVTAQPVTRSSHADLPPPLEPWIPWVRGDAPELLCPVRDGTALCLWPGRVRLDLDAQGGSFELQVWLDRAGLVPLPGSGASWPVEVRVDGKAVPVVAQGERPHCELTPGKHQIAGRFGWTRLPQTLSLPPSFARVELTRRGEPIERPKREEDGSLWLQAQTSGEEKPRLEMQVTRALRDGIPPRLDTYVRVRVAGMARELDLGQVLPKDCVPMSIASDLPARLDASGRLQLQVRAGSFELQIGAHLRGMPERIAVGEHPPPWPEQEVWVFEADERLRQVELSGLRAVDPAQVDLDSRWRGAPAFVARPGDVLQLKTVRRGDPEPIPDEVHLQRSLWLDQAGAGYSVHDRLHGELHASSRLDLLPYALGHVVVNEQDQLITRASTSGPTGVELRDTQLALQADYRIEQAPAELPAVGWSSDVRSLAIALNLPPGYELLGASGVDRVDHSWLSDWDLFGFFFVLIVALGAARVAGRLFGLVAFAALAVSYQEPDAPGGTWLVLIACVALLQHLRGPTARRTALGLAVLSALGLVLQGLPFAARSLREAIYPQLGAHGAGYEAPALDLPLPGRLAPEPDLQPTAASAPKPREAAGKAVAALIEEETAASNLQGSLGDSDAGAPQRSGAARLRKQRGPEDPDAVVQTGPGLPSWHWRSYQLSWSGPVQRDHRFSLWIAAPWLTRLVALLRVLLLALLAYGLFRAAARRGGGSGGPALPQAAAVALLVLCACPSSARADFPDSTLLGELRTRVTRPPQCRPECATIGELTLRVDAQGLRLDASASALDATSLRLPGPAATWVPERVQLDGADAPLRLHEDGFVHVRVLPGLHSLHVSGRLPAQDVVTLRLGDRPAQVRLQSSGYEVQGVREDGSVGDSLELKRLLQTSPDVDSEPEATPLPAWVTVTRELDLGYTFQAQTTVERETPLGSALVVHVPLLADESVHDARVQVHAGEAIVSLGPDDAALSFGSSLALRRELTLQAAAADEYTEVWRLRCGNSWQCQSTGLAPVSRESAGRLLSVFRPWPGERLQLALHKPLPAQGRTLTLDEASYRVVPGVRQSDASLHVHVRTSRAASPQLRLPEGARVRSLSVNGQPRPVHNAQRNLKISLQPGAADVELAFEHGTGMARVYAVPELTLDAPIANARLSVVPPADTWLLWVSGPAWGPAILFWGYLALCLLAAWALSRARSVPLHTVEWLLLAAGLTQVSSGEAVLVVGFFFAFAWRKRATQLRPLWHDLTQIGLVLLTLLAASALFDAVRHGLLVQPDMQVAGLGSHAGELQWYEDRTSGALPRATLVTLPLWVYRGLMLLWALWLASRLLRWLPWAFQAFCAGGIWKRKPKPPKPPPPGPTPQPSTTAPTDTT